MSQIGKEVGGIELESCSHFLLGWVIWRGEQVAIILSMHLHFSLSVVCGLLVFTACFELVLLLR